MEELRINISACYEDLGWKMSFAKTYQGEDKEWTKAYGDVRNAANKLSVGADVPLYRIIDSKLGTSFCKIRINPADTRGGYLQVTLFVEKGKRVDASKIDIKSILDKADDALPKDEDLKNFFIGDKAIQNDFIGKANEILKNASCIEDFKIDETTYLSEKDKKDQKTVYRVYHDDNQLCKEFFAFPHQQVTADFVSVYLVQEKNKPTSTDAMEITAPIQHVFTVKNGGDLYEVLEGGTVSVKCIKYANYTDVLPKNVDVDTKAKKDYYTIKDYDITVDESKLTFKKQTLNIYVKFPEMASIEEQRNLSVYLESDKKIEGQSSGNGSMFSFAELDMSKKYNLVIKSDLFHEVKKLPSEIDLNQKEAISKLENEDNAVALDFVQRTVNPSLSLDAILESFKKENGVGIVRVLCNGKEVKSENNKITVKKDEKYTFELSCSKELSFDINLGKIRSQEKPKKKENHDDADNNSVDYHESESTAESKGIFKKILDSLKNNMPTYLLGLSTVVFLALSCYFYFHYGSLNESQELKIAQLKNDLNKAKSAESTKTSEEPDGKAQTVTAAESTKTSEEPDGKAKTVNAADKKTDAPQNGGDTASASADSTNK